MNHPSTSPGRDELRLAEIELMRQRQRVAAMRHRLPPGAAVQDYVFQKVPLLGQTKRRVDPWRAIGSRRRSGR